VVIKNARVRWCKTGIAFLGAPGYYAVHTVRDSLFEWCDYGITADQNTFLSLVNVQAHDVYQGLYCQGYCSGSVTAPVLYTEKTFTGMRNNDPVNDPYGYAVSDPPDTMGAVGPSHFVEILNGAIAVYDKATGQRVDATSVFDFFAQPTTAFLFDPRIIYDHHCERWIACMVDRSTINPANIGLLFAVSQNSNPVGLTTSWSRYEKRFPSEGQQGFYPDSPTLGADMNGIYFVVHLYKGAPNPATRQKVIAVSKQVTSCLANISPSNIKVLDDLEHPYGPAIIVPAVNFDSVASNGIAWFVVKGAPQTSPPYQPGPIQYGRLKWTFGKPEFLEDPWSASNTIPAPHPYFDIECPNPENCPCTDPEVFCAKASGGATIPLAHTASRFQNAVVRNGHLWTCQHVGLNQQGTYAGDPVSALRSGCQWYKLQITGQNTLAVASHNRIYDPAANNFYFYYMPSLAVNSAGDLVIGFSGSRETEHIGAFYSGRLDSGTIPSRPTLIQAGRSSRGDSWGDYSYTSLDPDGLTFWTVQEYAETPAPGNVGGWGTWIAKVRK
jgi:hypothetical protein